MSDQDHGGAVAAEVNLSTEQLKALHDAERLIAKADEVEVTNDEQLEQATTLRSWVSERAKALDETRLSVTKPFRDGLDQLNGMFNERIKPLKDAKRIISDKMGRYMAEKEEAERKAREKAAEEARQKAEEEALKKAEEAQAQGDTEAADAALDEASNLEVAPPPKAPTKVQGTYGGKAHLRKTWVFELDPDMDPEEAVARVPSHYLLPPEERLNKKVIRAAISGDNGARDIPGLKIFQKTGVSG